MGAATSQPPLVSVVIPCFNRGKLVPRAIESVWAQDFESLEIVLVDDGSSDDTVAVIEGFAARDRRIRLIRHDRNRGEAAARNTGVRNARGEYIAFLDSDDEWLPNKLATQLDAMSRASALVGGCVTSAVQVMPDGREVPFSDWSDRLPITEENVLIGGCGLALGTTFLVRRAAYEKAGYYDESLPLLVDLDWLCRFLQHFSVIKLPEQFARYDKAPMRRGDLIERAVDLFVNKNRDYLRRFDPWTRRKIKSRFFAYISQSYQVHGPHGRFVATRGRCLLLNPFQPIKTHAHWLAAFLRVVRIGARPA